MDVPHGLDSPSPAITAAATAGVPLHAYFKLEDKDGALQERRGEGVARMYPFPFLGYALCSRRQPQRVDRQHVPR